MIRAAKGLAASTKPISSRQNRWEGCSTLVFNRPMASVPATPARQAGSHQEEQPAFWFGVQFGDLGRRHPRRTIRQIENGHPVHHTRRGANPFFFTIFISNSSSVRGQSSRNNRENARSASNFPPVWQVAQ